MGWISVSSQRMILHPVQKLKRDRIILVVDRTVLTHCLCSTATLMKWRVSFRLVHQTNPMTLKTIQLEENMNERVFPASIETALPHG